jgi:hypothetical protein
MHRSSFVLLVLAACTPNNAELTSGSYIAFEDDGTSLSLAKGELVPADYGDGNFWNMDCRTFASPDDEAALRIGCDEDDEGCDPKTDPAPINICGQNKGWPPEYEEWAQQSGFRVVTEELDPWRGEGLITSEGDLQIAFHHRVPGGADSRFVISIDPDFAPTTCRNTQSGYELVYYDGGGDGEVPGKDANGNGMPDDGWIERWSNGTEDHPQGLAYIASLDEDDPYRAAFDHFEPYLDGNLWLLNSGGFQLNPSETSDYWFLPDFWQAGAAQGRFVEENVSSRSPRYGEPFIYNFVDVVGTTTTTTVPGVTEEEIWYCYVAPDEDPADNACLLAQEEEVIGVARGIQDELGFMMSPDGDPDTRKFDYAPIAHTNFWRESDGRASGFDGWSELHYNYIVFSKDSDLSVGGRAEGAFSLTFDATESTTRLFVKGQFVIEKIKRDHWVTKELEQDKLIENEVSLCDAASPHDADPAKYEDPAKIK